MFLAGCFLPAHKGMTKQMFGGFGGIFWSDFGVYFLYMFVIPTCTKGANSPIWVTDFLWGITGDRNPKFQRKSQEKSPASHVGRPSTSTREWVWPCSCLVSQRVSGSKVELEVPPASFHISVLNTSFQWVLGWNYSGPSNWSVLEDVLFQRILVLFMVPAFMVLSILLCFILRGYSSTYQQLFIPILQYLFLGFCASFCFSYLFWGGTVAWWSFYILFTILGYEFVAPPRMPTGKRKTPERWVKLWLSQPKEEMSCFKKVQIPSRSLT